MTMVERKRRSDKNKWKKAIEVELIPTPFRIFHVRFKWVFIQKRNEKNEVVAQGFTQRPNIDFNETYSPNINGITFRYLISLAIQNYLFLQLMDVMTTYLYGQLDSDIYMKVPVGIPILNINANRNMYCVKLAKSLYGLKQSGDMWYNRLKKFFLNK
jgi:hypothetical protein